MKNGRCFIVLFVVLFGLRLSAQGNPENLSLINSSELEVVLFFNYPSCPGVCDGAVYVEVTGGQPPYSYSWFNGLTGTEYTGACSGTGSVTVTDAIDSVASIDFDLPEIPAPQIIFTNLILVHPSGGQNNGMIIIDTSMFVDTFPNEMYSLDSINFTPYHIFRNLAPGTYYIYTVDPLFGCIIRANNPLILYDITATQDLTSSYSFYPNPVISDLFINADIPIHVEILDINGHSLLRSAISQSVQLKLDGFPPGMYVAKISDEHKSVFRKIIKL